jgi:hypothetical protein
VQKRTNAAMSEVFRVDIEELVWRAEIVVAGACASLPAAAYLLPGMPPVLIAGSRRRAGSIEVLAYNPAPITQALVL